MTINYTSLKKLLLVVFSAVSLLATAQQVPANVMQMATAELQKRGLSESEVRERLLAEGIDVDKIKPVEYAQYQEKITTLLDEMQAEKSKKTDDGATLTTKENKFQSNLSLKTDNSVPGTKISEVEPQKAAIDTIPELYQDSIKMVNSIYGHSLFSNQTFDVVQQGSGIQVPDSYILGEGDVVHIVIFGGSQTEIQQKIAQDGSIKPAAGSRIFLKGISLGQARQIIKESLSRYYMFRDDQFAVSVVTTRTVLVNVLGETQKTGGFYLSAVNSALNALSAAGGPTEIGSVRNIQIIRGNNRKTIDLYEFMNDPAVQSKFDLQNNDILFVPAVQNLIKIEGAVKRPMRYEMLKNENLTDLIRYSGGLAMNANPEYIQIQRFTGVEEKLYEWNLAEVISGKTNVLLKDGDVVRILAVRQPLEHYVEVEGSVNFPGRFDVTVNNTLGKVLEKAKLNAHAKRDLIYIERTANDNTREMIPVVYAGSDAGKNFLLQPKDKVKVMEMALFGRSDTVFVAGEVKKPFKKVLSVNNRFTVHEAITYAGGVKLNVYPVAYIFRKNLVNPEKMSYIRVDLQKDSAMLLQPGDSLNIYDNRTYTFVGQLSISGAVNKPGSFIFDNSLTLKDLLINAGGLTIGAAYNRVEVFRVILSQTEKTKLRMISLKIDSALNLIGAENFSLQPYDHVVVRMTPDFTLGRTVELNGQVKYPGVYVLESKETTLTDVIRMAGGLLDDADPYGSQLFRTYRYRGYISIQLNKALSRQSQLKFDPILFEGDVLNINRMENTVTILSEGTRMAQYTIDMENTDSLRNVIFQGRKTASWYVRTFAGGFQKNVDRMSVCVTYPNNQMQSTKRFLMFRVYPHVEPGSVISMKMDVEKVQKDLEPKEKVDWEATISKGLSTLMSSLSIILLLRQL